MSCVALSRPELINYCCMNQHSNSDFTWRIHLIRNWTSLLNSFPSWRVEARLWLGYLTVPRYIRRLTILTNSSSCPALASSNLITSPPGNSWPKNFSIWVQVSEAVLLEKLHDVMYFEMYWAKNLPRKVGEFEIWPPAVVINYHLSWNSPSIRDMRSFTSVNSRLVAHRQQTFDQLSSIVNFLSFLAM